MATAAPRRMTLAEFLTWDDGTDTRYELVGGVVHAMPIGPVSHGVVLANLAGELGGNRLRPPHAGAVRGGIIPPHRADTYYLADVIVTRLPLNLDLQHFPEPVLIAEVVGPEEGGHDFGTKLPDYREIPSVREILLVSSRERRESDRRWIVRDLIGRGELHLEIADAAIPLAALYQNAAL